MFIMLNLKPKLTQSSGNELAPHIRRNLNCLYLFERLCWLLFWDSHGILLAHFMPKGQMITARYYSEVILKKLKEKWKKLYPRLVQKNVLLLYDNDPFHTASFTVELINSFKWYLLSHPLYRPDRAPLLLLFVSRTEKKRHAGNKYETKMALISAVNWYPNNMSTSWFAEGIQKLS